MESIHGAESWRLDNGAVSLGVTRVGGMVAPVAFRLGARTVSPYSLAPWRPDEVDAGLPGLLRTLRGDFFCLPFGQQGEGPPHGEPANLAWEPLEVSDERLVIALTAADSGARLERTVALRPDQAAIYHECRISGLDGRWSYGNHPILDASALPDGAARVSVSPFRWGSVYRGVFSDPEAGERQCLADGARFDELGAVPMADGGTADLTRWPARPGFEDLVMMVSEPSSESQPFAWSAVVMDGYVWFSLKNPSDFPATLFWMSNGGRDGEPWNGRHLGRLGVEEVCSHFCDSVEVSRASELRREGIPTTRAFRADETVSLRIVQAAAAVPADFGPVRSITPVDDGRVAIAGGGGATVEAAVDWSHVL